MQCLKCGSENSASVKFCHRCGNNLEVQRKEGLAEARRKQVELWRDRIWGTRNRKVITLLSSLFAVMIATVVSWPPGPTESKDWFGMFGGVFLKSIDLGRADNAYRTSIELQINSPFPGSAATWHQWDISVYNLQNTDWTKREQFNMNVADTPLTIKGLGSIKMSFSRSKSGDCNSQLWISNEIPITHHFQCSREPILRYEIFKRPKSRWLALTVNFEGGRANVGGAPHSVGGQGGMLYAVDLMRKRVVKIAGGENYFLQLSAISPKGSRALAYLGDHQLPHVFDLLSERVYASITDQVGKGRYLFQFADEDGAQLIGKPTKCFVGVDCDEQRLNVTKNGLVVAEP